MDHEPLYYAETVPVGSSRKSGSILLYSLVILGCVMIATAGLLAVAFTTPSQPSENSNLPIVAPVGQGDESTVANPNFTTPDASSSPSLSEAMAAVEGEANTDPEPTPITLPWYETFEEVADSQSSSPSSGEYPQIPITLQEVSVTSSLQRDIDSARHFHKTTPFENAAPEYLKTLSVIEPSLSSLMTRLSDSDRSILETSATANRDLINRWYDEMLLIGKTDATAEQLARFDELYQRLRENQEKSGCDFKIIDEWFTSLGHIEALNTLKRLTIVRFAVLSREHSIQPLIDDLEVMLRIFKDFSHGGVRITRMVIDDQLDFYERGLPYLWSLRNTKEDFERLREVLISNYERDSRLFEQSLAYETINFRLALLQGGQGDPGGHLDRLLRERSPEITEELLSRNVLIVEVMARSSRANMEQTLENWQAIVNATNFVSGPRQAFTSVAEGMKNRVQAQLEKQSQELRRQGGLQPLSGSVFFPSFFAQDFVQHFALAKRLDCYRGLAVVQTLIQLQLKLTGRMPDDFRDRYQSNFSDPFSGAYFLSEYVNGYPIIYSVGPNGKDELTYHFATEPLDEVGDLYLFDPFNPPQ